MSEVINHFQGLNGDFGEYREEATKSQWQCNGTRAESIMEKQNNATS